MLATAGPLPEGPDWAYELKWDGVRVLADVTVGALRLSSRSEQDVTAAYPELLGLADVCEDALFDGEVVAFTDGRPSFAALQPRMHVRNATQARRLMASTPVTYLVFDLLRLYGVDLTERSYAERRATLERLELESAQWMVSPAFDDGPATMQAGSEQGMEGVVAKRLTSRYRPGARTPEWVKVRFSHRQEFVVGGWERGTGERTNRIGALVLGYYENDKLVYAGQVGSGFSAADLARLSALLGPLRQDVWPFDTPPPPADSRDVEWCAPEMVVDVEFAEWTPGGRLRFPTFQGLRDDKDPREVVRE